MTELEKITFEIENFKKQMAVLFIVADEDIKNELLDELNNLLQQRGRILDQDNETDE